MLRLNDPKVSGQTHVQSTHGTGKTGKMATKKIPVRENTGNLEILSKHRKNTGNFVKTQGILLAQVVNVLIEKVNDFAIVVAKKLFFFQKLDRSAKSVLCM